MPNGTYGGVRGRKTKVGRKLFRFPLTRFPYFEKCGNIVPLCVVTSICGRGGTKINVVTFHLKR